MAKANRDKDDASINQPQPEKSSAGEIAHERHKQTEKPETGTETHQGKEDVYLGRLVLQQYERA